METDTVWLFLAGFLFVLAVLLLAGPTWRYVFKVNQRREFMRKDRLDHDDRDFNCKYWWGDRSGYSTYNTECLACKELENR